VFQFKDHRQQQPIAAPGKTLHLAGDYGQLYHRGLYGEPNFGLRGATVDVAKQEARVKAHRMTAYSALHLCDVGSATWPRRSQTRRRICHPIPRQDS
jgi:hypothetical protein